MKGNLAHFSGRSRLLVRLAPLPVMCSLLERECEGEEPRLGVRRASEGEPERPSGRQSEEGRGRYLSSACQRRLERVHHSLPGKVPVGLVSVVLHLPRHAVCWCEAERNGDLRVTRLRPAGSHTGRQDERIEPVHSQAGVNDTLRLVHICFCLCIGRITQTTGPIGLDKPARMSDVSESASGLCESEQHSLGVSFVGGRRLFRGLRCEIDEVRQRAYGTTAGNSSLQPSLCLRASGYFRDTVAHPSNLARYSLMADLNSHAMTRSYVGSSSSTSWRSMSTSMTSAPSFCMTATASANAAFAYSFGACLG